jgi:hypothetical protein
MPCDGSAVIVRHALLAVAVLVLSGCAGRLARPATPAVLVPAAAGQYTLTTYQTDFTKYTAASGDEARRLRNKMVYGLLAEIDYVYYEYETRLFLDHGSFAIGSDIVQLGLAAGSTVSNGQRGKTILSALLSGATGTNLSFDKNLFRQQTVQAITSSMRAERDRIKTIVLQQLTADTVTYPFEAARPDLIRYFFAGTLAAGLQQLHELAGTEAQTQQANLANTQVHGITATEVKGATDVNGAVAKAFADNNLSKVVAFLKAMGASVDEASTKDKLESELRSLGRRIATDEALRKKYFEEARKAQLIQ